jgi:preprotein translocase SecE subunit
MARNRQRAKQRQEARRAERLARARPDALPNEEALEELELYSGAPPTDTGRSDTVVENPPPAPEFDGDDDDLEEPIDVDEPVATAEPAETAADGTARRRARQAAHEPRHHRNRLLSFLIAVWAELQRVEWPDRQTLTMLTGVVLLFVIVMGAYLGLLDAVFSRLINKIL